MSKINICGLDDNNDPFYRYKMEKVNIVVQKNKSNIMNLHIIANEIYRDVNLLVNYYKKKFNTSVIFKNNILTVSGIITTNEFEEALREFIEYYVLCPVCRLPQTELVIVKNKIEINCKCCPNSTEIKRNNIKSKICNKLYDSLIK